MNGELLYVSGLFRWIQSRTYQVLQELRPSTASETAPVVHARMWVYKQNP
jgi:hypothetical protein